MIHWPNEFPVLIILKIHKHLSDLKKPFIEETHWTLTLTCPGLMTWEHFNIPKNCFPPEFTLGNPDLKDGKVDLSFSVFKLNTRQAGPFWVWKTCWMGTRALRPSVGVSPIKVVGSRLIFLLCSQEPGHCHSRGPGQPSQQPLSQVPQHCAEDSHELAALSPQCRTQGLCSGSFQRLPEYHWEIAGNAWCWEKWCLAWPQVIATHSSASLSQRASKLSRRKMSVWWTNSQMLYM